MLLSGAASSGAQTPATQPATESLPGTLVRFDLVRVPGGTLRRGGDGDGANPVDIKPFWIGKTEVTWDLFDVWAFQLDLTQAQPAAGADAQARPSKPYGAPDRGFGHAGYPALAMTRHAAEAFCRWLSKKTGKTYRLPTEAEWEYACRAGVVDEKHVAPDELAKQAWSAGNSDEKTHPVGTKPPNAWGLHDMAGNVGEWVTPVDGDKTALIARGGSYNDAAEEVGCGARATQDESWNETDPQDPKSKWWLSDGPFVGFRVVRED